MFEVKTPQNPLPSSDGEDDKDLIPDLLQKTGQSQKPLEKKVEAKKPGFLSKLLGTTPKKSEPWHKQHEDLPKPGEPKPTADWTPIDFSDSRKIKWNKNFNDPRNFQQNVKHDLKSTLGTILSPQQRSDVAKMIKQSRTHGLRAGELSKKLDQEVKAGKLSKFEAKKIRQSMHLKRSSGML